MEKTVRDRNHTTRVVQMERGKYTGSRGMYRSCTYAVRDTSQNDHIKFHGIPKREK